MVFAYDTEQALQSAVVLVNSAEPPDSLTTIEELDDFYTGFGYTGRRDRTRRELDAVRAPETNATHTGAPDTRRERGAHRSDAGSGREIG